jgi:hypothetical protein
VTNLECKLIAEPEGATLRDAVRLVVFLTGGVLQ